MATYRATGFVIKRNDFGEADRILTLFTQYHGKVSAMAKGVRRMESRKGGNVDLFNLVRLQLAEGKSMELVVEADVEDSFRHVKDDLHLLSIAYQLTEIVDQFTQEDQSNPEGYFLFKQVMEELDKMPKEEQARALLLYFEINFLSTVGFKPELRQCVKCGNRLFDSGNLFSPVLGGVVDKDCRQTVAVGLEVSNDSIKTLRFLEANNLTNAKKLKIEKEVLEDVDGLLKKYIEFILERDLKAADFAAEARQM